MPVDPVDCRVEVASCSARAGCAVAVDPVQVALRLGACAANGGASALARPLPELIAGIGPVDALGIINPSDEELAALLAWIA